MAHVQLEAKPVWLSLTLMGVSCKLTAMFALAHAHDQRIWIAGLGTAPGGSGERRPF